MLDSSAGQGIKVIIKRQETMNKQFFILVNNSNPNVPGVSPLLDVDSDDAEGRLETFDTYEEAMDRCRNHEYIFHFGYYVYDRNDFVGGG